MKFTWIIFIGVLLVILLFVFSNYKVNQLSSGSNEVAVERIVMEDSTNNRAPNFILPDLNGEDLNLKSYIGVKPVVLDFWASWCHNCQRDMPRLNSWYEEFNGEIEVIGVNMRESKNTVEKFIASKEIDFPIVYDARGVATSVYGVRYTNTHVLINKMGVVVDVILGDMSKEQFAGLLYE